MARKISIFFTTALFFTFLFSSVGFAETTPLYSFSFDDDLGGSTPIERTAYYSDNGLVESSGSSFSYSEGKLNNALHMYGNEALKLPVNMNSDKYSVSFWIKPDKITNCTPTFMLTADGFVDQNFINITVSVDNISPCAWTYISDPYERESLGRPGLLEIDEWLHLTLVVDGSISVEDGKNLYNVNLDNNTILGKFYINGYFIEAGRIPKNVCSDTSGFWFGANVWDDFYKGMVDELYLFDTALTDEEVKENFILSGGSKDEKEPVGNSSVNIGGNNQNNGNGFSDDYITINQGSLSSSNNHLNLDIDSPMAGQGVETTTNTYSYLAKIIGVTLLVLGVGLFLTYYKKTKNSYT